MKVNREKFLAAALLLSSVTACGKLKGKETATAAPDTVQSASDPAAAASAPAAEEDKTSATAKGSSATAGNTTKNARAKVGVTAPSGEVIPVVGPGKEVIAPNNEGVIAPGKEVIAPGNENVPVVAPTNENVPAPTPAPTGTAMKIPKGRVRTGK